MFKEHTIPNISFIEGEMSLSGKVNFENPIESAEIKIATPGSYGTHDPAITPDRYYPAYNEALGLFAVLESPKVLKRHFVIETPGDPEGGGLGVDYSISSDYQFSPSDFKYYFNPAAEVNIEKTRIYGALILKINNPAAETLSLYNLNEEEGDTGTYYITDFYPIESLQRVIAHFGASDLALDNIDIDEVNLRLQIFYEFKPNKYGKVNRYYEILTYPTEIVSVEELEDAGPLEQLPDSLTINDQHYSSNTIIKAVNKITIDGTISTDPGVTVILIAGEEIEVKGNPSIIQSNVVLKTGLPNAYGDDKIYPVSQNYVTNFCNTQYMANQIVESVQARVNTSTENPDIKNTSDTLEDNDDLEGNSIIYESFKIYPNPAKDQLNIVLPVERELLNVEIYTIKGEQVATAKGITIPVSNLAEGVYFVIIQLADGERITKKVIVSRD